MKNENENEKKYLIGTDNGYAMKVAFIQKGSKDFADRKLSTIMKFVELAGDEEKNRGFHASTPTIFTFMENLHEVEWEPFYRHQSSLYARHKSPHPDIIVYCHVKKLSGYEESSAASKFIKDLMKEFPGSKS
jgi:hypothetical protein